MKKKVAKKAVRRVAMPKQIMVKGWSKNKDKMLVAKKVGKRKSKSGKTYYEYRVNRSDKNRKVRL